MLEPLILSKAPDWHAKFISEFTKPYFIDLDKFVLSEYSKKTIYPPEDLIFNAFELCPFEDVKVVIIGQDPYHGIGQAHGLAFSTMQPAPFPSSLRNIYRELSDDLQISANCSGDLTRWANQGVLLLNSILTVRKKSPNSHSRKGWEIFTDAIIRELDSKKENLVFILWGKKAQEKGKNINRKKHLVLEASHPSWFSASRGFFGCKHFSQTNDYLVSKGKIPIIW